MYNQDKEYNILAEKFKTLFGKAELIVQAPARVNIIGEHTDYNDGFVLPFACDRYIWFFVSPNVDRKLKLHAADTDQTAAIDLDNLQIEISGFERYFAIVCQYLQQNNYKFDGLNIVFGGTIPAGAGMSSSSAITCGFLYLLNKQFDLSIPENELPFVASNAENLTGLNGGFMDQFAIFNGKKEHAILLDCRDRNAQQVPLHLQGHHFYLFNTNVKHNLVDTEYNNRRQDCAEVLQHIAKSESISSVREITKEFLDKYVAKISEKQYNRVHFVIKENERVLHAIKAIEKSDFEQLGKLLLQSHQGLSQEYEVSCPELDFLVEKAQQYSSILGSRMMGGGFGGCTINLIKEELPLEVCEEIKLAYQQKFGRQVDIWKVGSSDGIGLVSNKATG